jgi:hypothetical protein
MKGTTMPTAMMHAAYSSPVALLATVEADIKAALNTTADAVATLNKTI